MAHDVSPILQDLHAIIHKLNMTLEFFNGMSHKTIKSVRKQILYINDRFKDALCEFRHRVHQFA